MSEKTPSRIDDHDWNIARYRYTMAATGILYPIWGAMYQWMLSGRAYDPMGQRLAVTAAVFAFGASTWSDRKYHRWVSLGFVASILLVIGHVFYLVVKNDLNPVYILGAYTVMFASGSMLLSLGSLLTYFLTCVAVTATVMIVRADLLGVFLFLGAVTSLGVSFASSGVVLSVLRALQVSRNQLAARSDELGRVNGELTNVMNSLGQGFFSFGADGLCKQTYSRACVVLLEKSPAGLPVAEVLGVPPADLADFRDWVDLCFTMPEAMRPPVLELGRTHYAHSRGLRIVIEYFPVCDADGSMTEMVVVATDRTSEYRLEQQAASEQARLRMIATVVEQRAMFRPFLTDLQAHVNDFAGSPGSAEDLSRNFKRFLHTIKGGFGLFAIDGLAKSTHDLESAWGGDDPPRTLTEVRALIDTQSRRLIDEVASVRTQLRLILGSSMMAEERMIEMPLARALDLLEQNRRSGPRTALADEVEHLTLRPIGEFFRAYEPLMRSLAERQEKRVSELRLHNDDLLIFPEPYHDLFSSFVHVFRNAVDHGIEPFEERLATGKPGAGTVEVTFEAYDRGGPRLRIIVGDDGRGLDVARLRESLARKGLLESYERSGKDPLHSIFEPEFSTKDVVSEVSGRGVGLDALKAVAEAHGGAVDVRSTPGAGMQLIVDVPLYLVPQTALRAAG